MTYSLSHDGSYLLGSILISIFQSTLRTLTVISRLPSMLLSSNILFEDALGRVVSLPYEHFKHYPVSHPFQKKLKDSYFKVFLARLQCEFMGTPGEQRVVRNQFHIMLEPSNQYISNDTDWINLVKPRTKIMMSMIFERVGFRERWWRAMPRCPQCKGSKEFRLARQVREGNIRWYASGSSLSLV